MHEVSLLNATSHTSASPRVGDIVTVWFSDGPAKLEGKVVKVIVPGEAVRVEITTPGELGSTWDHLVGEDFDMWRLKDLKDAKYDDYFWSPRGEEVPDGRQH